MVASISVFVKCMIVIGTHKNVEDMTSRTSVDL